MVALGSVWKMSQGSRLDISGGSLVIQHASRMKTEQGCQIAVGGGRISVQDTSVLDASETRFLLSGGAFVVQQRANVTLHQVEISGGILRLLNSSVLSVVSSHSSFAIRNNGQVRLGGASVHVRSSVFLMSGGDLVISGKW